MPGRVHEQVLDDPFDLGRVDRDHDRIGFGNDLPSRQDVEALDRPSCERTDIGHPVLRLNDAAVKPVDVQEILEQPVELRCVLGQSPEQIPPIGVWHLRGSFKRE